MKKIAVLVGWGMALAAGADPALVDYDLGWIFPQKLGGMEYTMAERYNNTALGYSVFYALGESFDATVSVFDFDRTSIPDGCAGEGVEMVAQSVESALQRMEEQGRISGLKKRGTTVVPKQGPVQFASTVFQYQETATNGVQKIKSAYVTGVRNNFLKLEFTFDLLEGNAARTMADEMVSQLIEMIQAQPDEQTLLMASCAALLHDPNGLGGRAGAQRVVAKTQTMENLNIYSHLFAWPDGYGKPQNADLLVAAYFAGMLQVVVPQNLEEGGEFEAFIAMLTAYEVMRSKDEIEAIPAFEEWVVNPDKKALYAQLLIEE